LKQAFCSHRGSRKFAEPAEMFRKEVLPEIFSYFEENYSA